MSTQVTRLSIQLDPQSSARLLRAVDAARRRRGWPRHVLAARSGVTADVLNTWTYGLKNDRPLRIGLEKALQLLAAVGIGENLVDDLWWELSGVLAGLVDEAEQAATEPLPGEIGAEAVTAA